MYKYLPIRKGNSAGVVGDGGALMQKSHVQLQLGDLYGRLQSVRAMTREATMNLKRMADGAARHVEKRLAAGNPVGSSSFPRTVKVTPGNPTKFMCRQGVAQAYATSGQTWRHPTWMALGFAAKAPMNYAYEFISVGTGASARFTARAMGDIDCNGVLSTFERMGRIDASGRVILGAGIYGTNELE